MKKILYLMHLPWGWVKQRPHFIAEGLSRYFEVCVFGEKQYLYKGRLVRNESRSSLRFEELFKLPHINAPFFLGLNSLIMRRQLKRIIDYYDFIWLTHPNLVDRISGIVPAKSRIIYDCMDDFLEFPYLKAHRRFRDMTLENEKALFERSDIIFASSHYLKGKLHERYGTQKEIFVANNALFLEDRETGAHAANGLPPAIREMIPGSGFNLLYAGAISEWLDLEIIKESLDMFGNINYLLFGPCEVKLPVHKRIIYGGPVEHRYVFDLMQTADALIMPFHVNELILSVNPVKLYEYIFSCKPSLAVEYGETLQFRDFVHLYKTREEYFSLITKLTEHSLSLKKDCQEYRRFAEKNTWDRRIEEIAERIR